MLKELSIDRALISVGAAATFFVAFEFILLRYNLTFPASGLLAFLIALAIGLGLARSLSPAPSLPSRRDLIPSAMVIGVFSVMVAFQLWAGYILPVHDPIAVPAFAQIVARGLLPMEVYQPGDSGFTYPPGYPILLSPLFALASPYAVLQLFKWINLAVVMATPAVWAWAIARLFPITLRPWHILAAAYLVFFGIERTLPFTLPFAGKNAMLLAGLLFPVLIVILIESARISWQFVAGAVCFFGLTLIHFAVLHMAAAVIAGYLVSQVPAGAIRPGKVFLLGVAGVLAAAGLFITLQEVLHDPRAGGFGPPNISVGLTLLREAFTSSQSSILVVYGPDFGVLGSPYRGLVLLLCLLLCLTAPLLAPADRNLRSIRKAATSFFVAIVISIAFAYGIIPAGIREDFVRWFLFFFQAAFMTVATLALLTLATQPGGRARFVFASVSAAIVLVALTFMNLDTVRYQKWNKSQRVTKGDLIEAATAITTAASGRKCLLISESIGMLDDFVIFQLAKPLEYLEYLTRCTFVNGSYLHRSDADARSLEGLPPAAMLESLPKDTAILLIAGQPKQEKYAAQLEASGRAFAFIRKGTASGLGVWEIRP